MYQQKCQEMDETPIGWKEMGGLLQQLYKEQELKTLET